MTGRSGAPPGLEAPSPLQRPEFRRLLAISITVAVGFAMVIPVLPDFARSFGVGLAAIGLIQLVFGLTRFSFGLVGGLAVDRFGERTTTVAGILIVSASSYAAGLSQSFLQLVLARGFGGAGSALFIAGLMNRILRVIEPEAMGRATGAFRSSFLIGIGLGPVLGGIAGDRLGLLRWRGNRPAVRRRRSLPWMPFGRRVRCSETSGTWSRCSPRSWAGGRSRDPRRSSEWCSPRTASVSAGPRSGSP